QKDPRRGNRPDDRAELLNLVPQRLADRVDRRALARGRGGADINAIDHARGFYVPAHGRQTRRDSSSGAGPRLLYCWRMMPPPPLIATPLISTIQAVLFSDDVELIAWVALLALLVPLGIVMGMRVVAGVNWLLS